MLVKSMSKNKTIRQELREVENAELDKKSTFEILKYLAYRHRVGLISVGWAITATFWIVQQAPTVAYNLTH